jgi:peptidylprolyl isomerase
VTLVLLSTSLGGCNRQAAGVVGSAGGTTIDSSQINKIVAALPIETQRAVARDTNALEQVVRGELLRRALVEEARAAKIDDEPKVAEQLARLRDDAMVRIWLAQQAKVADDYPSEQELSLAFDANVEALTPPARYKVAQIFISAPNGIAPPQLALALRKASEVGAQIPDVDFGALARRYSEHADSAAKGGEVGMLPADQMLPEIVAAVRGLNIGETTGPIKTSQGLHYVKLIAKEVSPAPSLDESRERLRNALRAQRAQELERALIARRSADLAVKIDQITLAEVQSSLAAIPAASGASK